MRAAGIDTEAVVRAGMIGFLEGCMMHGIFHGDLHGGNLFVLPSGKIALLDFGITGRLTEAEAPGAALAARRRVQRATSPRRWPRCATSGAFPDDVDVQHVIDMLGLDRPPVDPTTLTPDELVAEMQRSIKTLLGLGARLPKELMLFVKNMMFLDGAIATLAPDLDLFAEVEAIALHVRRQARRADHVPARPRAPGGLGAGHGRGQGGLRAGRVDREPHPPRAPGPPGPGAREVQDPTVPRPGRPEATHPEVGRATGIRLPAGALRRLPARHARQLRRRSPIAVARPRTGRTRCSLWRRRSSRPPRVPICTGGLVR